MTWSHALATDNSGLIPNITLYGKRPGDLFPAGEHNVRYLASDKTGNVAECKFKVFVLGNLRMPHVEIATDFVLDNLWTPSIRTQYSGWNVRKFLVSG